MKKIGVIFLLLAALTEITAAPIEHYVNVGAQRYSILQSGSGSPTVIFFNGAGESLQSWNKVFSQLGAARHLFAYDRAGVGQSMPLPNQIAPRTAAGVVKRLRALLHMVRLNPPYVLVAHSLGSLYALYFARAYPTEVTGLVLLEPSVDAMIALNRVGHLNKKQQTAVAGLVHQINFNFLNEKARFVQYRSAIKHQPTAKEATQIELYLENLGKTESQQQIDQLPPLKNISLVVISSDRGTTQYDRFRRLAAKTIAHSAARGQYQLLKNVGHNVQKDAPAKVVAAINNVISK